VNLTQYHAREVVEDDESAEDGESGEWDTLESSGDKIVPSIALVAFTGQATQVLRRNMPGTWKANVMTIHSLLGYAPVDYFREDGSKAMRFEPSYTKDFKMPWDVIFIDEASMVNVTLWHQILDASKPGCRFYMIGDLNQLTPPVGDGILGFALSKWPVFELQQARNGGPVAAGKSYLVGERGPEMFHPSVGGRISQAGGGVKVDLIDQRGASAPPVDVSRQMAGGMEQIRVMIRSEVGGMFNDGTIDRQFRAASMPVRRSGSR
jgi:hypothetical protein